MARGIPQWLLGPGLTSRMLGWFASVPLCLSGCLVFGQTPPPNDNFANATPIIGVNLTVTGSNDFATKEPGEPDHAGNNGGKSVWWTWQTTNQCYVTLSTRGSTSSLYGGPLDTLLAVYTGSAVDALAEVASNDEDPTTYYTSRLGFTALPGVIYRIAVDGYTYDFPTNADSGAILLSLTVTPPSTNDNFANATVITGTNLNVTGNNDSASKEPGEPNHAGNPGGKSVWWSWQAPASGYVRLSTAGSISSQSGSELYALTAVYVGGSVSNLASVAQELGDPVDLIFHVNAGVTYHIVIDGYFDGINPADSGNIELSLSFSTSLPSAPVWGPVPDINGNYVYSADFGGKVVVLNFWATWCPPCVAEIPDLVSLYDKYSSDGLAVVGISVDTSSDGMTPPSLLVSSFASSHGMDYPMLVDRPSWSTVEWLFGGIDAIPTTFVLDRQNRIWAHYVGSQSYSTFESAVLPLLYPNLSVNLSVNGGMAHLSWPATQASFVLESSTTASPGSWTLVSAAPQSDGISQFIDLQLGVSPQFFRLHHQ